MRMERKNNELKLPAIQHRQKQSKVLSSTMPDNGTKLRPASLNKVDDLEKKLFSKLDAYEAVSKRGTKRASRKSKLGESENGISGELEGYEKLQKLMPGLYGKLLEAKKCSTSIEMTPSTIQTPASYKSQASLASRQGVSAEGRREEKQVSIFITGKEQPQEEEKVEMSEAEMNELYQDYIERENLGKETSALELEELSESMLACEREIAQLTKSMEGLIREIGMQCVGEQ